MPSTATKKRTSSDDRYQPTAWGSETLEDLTCPSGQLAQVRRCGADGLIKAGIIQSMDVLTAIVENELIPSAEGRPVADPAKLLKDPEALASVLHMTDKIVQYVVVQPELALVPDDVTQRKPGTIYTDMVDMEDKMFIMNFALGGTRDLETFRKESKAAVGSMGHQQVSRPGAKRSPRNN